jgi:hypothetical protein
MTSDRLFCRFNRGRSTSTGRIESPMSLKEIPLGGLCLSVFLVLRDEIGSVLLGKIDPGAPWDYLGALDSQRIELYRKGWMLPASHLIVHESPHAAALRIAREQLELGEIALSDPRIVSEVYPPKYFPDFNEHWDLEFIFISILTKERVPSNTHAFKEIKMLDPKKTKRSEIARSHDDILASVGIDLLS